MRQGDLVMKMYRFAWDIIPQTPASACAIGYFDGLHQGHMQLIERAKQQAAKAGIQSAVMTFDPDPWTIFYPEREFYHLTTLEDKQAILESMGIDLFYVVDFSKSFASLSIEQFHELLHGLHIETVVCGFDFTYGQKGAGNAWSLKEAFHTEVVSPVTDHEEKISSTRIEGLIQDGKIEEANELLGYCYSLKGTIVSGFQRGRKMSFPTANLKCHGDLLYPKVGVYAGYVYDGLHLMPAMINVGKNPTFGNDVKTVEAFVLLHNVSLYGKDVRFYFCAWLRSEKKFESPEDLAAQLQKDENSVLPALAPWKGLMEHTVQLWSLRLLDDILNE